MNILKFMVIPLVLCEAAIGGEVEIEFKFKRGVSYVGLVWFPDDTGLDGVFDKSKPIEVDQIDFQFTEKLIVAPQGAKLRILNNDTVAHHAASHSKPLRKSIDLGVTPAGVPFKEEIIFDWGNGNVILFECDLHPKMKLFAAQIASKKYQIVDFKKRQKTKKISIKDVDKNLKKISIWLHKYQRIENLQLTPGKEQIVELKKPGKKRKRGEIKIKYTL